MNLLIHALSPLIFLASTGSGTPQGKPPLEKTLASQYFTDVQVLVNGDDATNRIVTVRKDAKRMSITVTMKVDKKFGPLEFVDVKTKKYDGTRWLATATSEFKKPEVMAGGRLKATLDVPIPAGTGENHLRIRAFGEKHNDPVYIAEGVIRVVAEE